MACLLGVDNGLTVTKAVVFDESGAPLAVARRRIAQAKPAPRHVERDMEEMWRETAAAIRDAIVASGRPASDIKAVAATAHGDGLYLIDRAGRPLGPGVLSLDSRAAETVARWRADGISQIRCAGVDRAGPRMCPRPPRCWRTCATMSPNGSLRSAPCWRPRTGCASG